MVKTTITVETATLERFKRLKAELDEAQDAPDHSADTFLSALLDTWEKVDAEGYGGQETPNADLIAEQVVDLFTSEVFEPAIDQEKSALGYDDVRNATRQALKEELPDRVFR